MSSAPGRTAFPQRRLLAAGAALVLGSCLLADAMAASGSRTARPVRAHDLAHRWHFLSADGVQFIRATRKGKVHVLDMGTMRDHEITIGGRDAGGTPLEPLEEASTFGYPQSAAMSPQGDAWLVQTVGGRRELRYFVNGKEQILGPPPPWVITSVGLPDGGAVVAVASLLRDTGAVDQRQAPWPEAPPLLMQWTGSSWVSYLPPAVQPRHVTAQSHQRWRS